MLTNKEKEVLLQCKAQDYTTPYVFHKSVYNTAVSLMKKGYLQKYQYEEIRTKVGWVSRPTSFLMTTRGKDFICQSS